MSYMSFGRLVWKKKSTATNVDKSHLIETALFLFTFYLTISNVAFLNVVLYNFVRLLYIQYIVT